MYKKVFFVSALVVASLALGIAVAAAQLPDVDDIDCLPDCYASDKPLKDRPSVGDGFYKAPWVLPDSSDRDTLRDRMKQAVQIEGDVAVLRLTLCEGKPKCVWYEYTYTPRASGNEAREEITVEEAPGEAPKVGVNLPFPYLLGGGLVLGVALVTTGVVLRQRAGRTT
jgi:hypothetical protein